MTTNPQYPLTESEASAEAARLIREAYRLEEATPVVTTFRDTSPAIGTAAPVVQPDSRIVPEWATGVAVASIGIGAGVTGIGCGAWLILEGLSSMTLLGVIGMFAPFAGITCRSASTETPYRRDSHAAIAARSSGSPAAVG